MDCNIILSMKKIILTIIAAAAVAFSASAQSRALGIRSTYGAEISYQYDLGANFVEADLGWFGHGFYLTGVYDYKIASEGRFNFYGGPGAALGFYDYDEESGLNLGIVGQLGVEYNFDLPITFSLDWRPVWNFMYGGFGWEGIGFAVRYRF